MSYRIVIYTKRKGIPPFTSYIIAEKCSKLESHIASLKMHRTHTHRKFQQNGFAPAHRNSQLAIAHRKSCLGKYISTLIMPETSPFFICQKLAVLSCFLQVFMILRMYNCGDERIWQRQPVYINSMVIFGWLI